MDINILYINLDKRLDRKKHIENELVGLNYERIEAVLDQENGYKGCVQSHIKALNYAKEKGYSQVIIIEDDFEFIEKNKFTIPTINFDVCLFEVLVKKKEIIEGEGSYIRVLQGEHTGCYLIKEHYYDTLIQNFQDSCDLLQNKYNRVNFLDIYWIALQEQDMFITPTIPVGQQREDYSDIQGINIKRY